MSFALKSQILLAALSVVAQVPAVPVTDSALYDPDDQLRFISEFHPGVYERLVADGFNGLMKNWEVPNGLSVLTNVTTAPYYKQCAKNMLECLAKCERDHVNFIENMPEWGHRAAFWEQYPVIARDGSRVKACDASNTNFLAEVSRQAMVKARDAATLSRAYCGIRVAGETRDMSRPSFSLAQAERYFRETGRQVPSAAEKRLPPYWKDIPDFPANRVIDEDYPLLHYYRWFWNNGDGWNCFNSAINDAFSRVFGQRPHISIFGPPLRAPQLWSAGGNISHGFDWSYMYPQPVLVAALIAQQQAWARGDKNRRVLAFLQSIAWRRDIAGPDAKLPAGVEIPVWSKEWPKTGFPTMPPDLMLEGLWLAFAHRIDGIGTHGWNCIYDGRPLGDNQQQTGYSFTHPGLQPVISNMFHTVSIPLGPYLRAVPERPTEVGMLFSYAAELFGGDPSGHKWDFRALPHLYSYEACLAGLSPYILYDEEIARDGIPAHIKVLLLRDCSVLTATTYRHLVAFQRRGGKILADDQLAPAIKADGPLPLQAYDWHEPKWFDDYGRGVLVDAATRLRSAVERYCELPICCDNRDVIVHARQAGSADLVFAINDKRKFGNYVGQWKKCMEEGVPNAAKLTLRHRAGAVYDIVKHEKVPFKVVDGQTVISLKYTTCDGRALLVCDHPLKPLRIRRADGDAIRVETADTDVMIPIGVFPANGKPRYGVLKGGKWTRRVPGGQVRVQNLATGEWFADSPAAALGWRDESR